MAFFVPKSFMIEFECGCSHHLPAAFVSERPLVGAAQEKLPRKVENGYFHCQGSWWEGSWGVPGEGGGCSTQRSCQLAPCKVLPRPGPWKVIPERVPSSPAPFLVLENHKIPDWVGLEGP